MIHLISHANSCKMNFCLTMTLYVSTMYISSSGKITEKVDDVNYLKKVSIDGWYSTVSELGHPLPILCRWSNFYLWNLNCPLGWVTKLESSWSGSTLVDFYSFSGTKWKRLYSFTPEKKMLSLSQNVLTLQTRPDFTTAQHKIF